MDEAKRNRLAMELKRNERQIDQMINHCAILEERNEQIKKELGSD